MECDMYVMGLNSPSSHLMLITPPMANSDASVSRQNSWSWLGYYSTGAVVKAAFKASNEAFSLSPKLNKMSLQVRSTMGRLIIA